MFPRFVLPLVNPTVVPPEGAAPFNVVLTVSGAPPDRFGVPRPADTKTGQGGFTVRTPETELPPVLAVMAACVVPATGVVDAGKVALDCPAGTETDGATVTLALLLKSCTIVPFAGLEPDSVTVPVAD